jgi:hypothetical protein
VYVGARVSARMRVCARACLSANRCQPLPHNLMRDAESRRAPVMRLRGAALECASSVTSTVKPSL